MQRGQRDVGHVVVTGASSGIGHGIARAFMTAGNKLTLVARRRAPMDELAREAVGAGVPALVCEADLADLAQATSWIDQAEATQGPIDVFVANAGVQILGPSLDHSDAKSEAMHNLNFLTPLRQARRVGRAMAARGEGTLVVIASVASFTAAPGLADYSASKAAVATFFETLRVELAPSGVNVVTVYPGPVKTAMEAAARTKIQPGFLVRNLPIGTPEELGALVRAAVRGGRDRVIYPKFYQTSRQFPRLAQWLTNRLAPPMSS